MFLSMKQTITLLLVYFIFTLVFGIPNPNQFSLPTSEIRALYSLYNNTQGEDWIWRNKSSHNSIKWSFYNESIASSNPCDAVSPWQGITCSSYCSISPCNVLKLNLDVYNLRGHLPGNISGLTALTNLTLSGNHLVGSIPAELGLLSDLTHLNLSGNLFFGQLPTEMFQLMNLTQLDAGFNFLTGPIPAEIGNLKNLVHLDLSRNIFEDSIPAELGLLVKLKYVLLNQNRLSKEVPSQLGLLTNLVHFYINTNRLTHTIPPQLANLSSLKVLDLSYNAFSGPIPVELTTMVNLTGLFLNYNSLTSTIPAEFGKMTGLNQLSVRNNNLTGTIPPQLGNMSSLVELHLDYNQLSQTIPPELGQLGNLTKLIISSNNFTGSIPAALGQLASLEIADFTANRISGSIPAELGNLTRLYDLFLAENYLTGHIPPTLGNLKRMAQFVLNSNLLSGSIPPELGNFKHVFLFDLSENNLWHALPVTLCSINRLRYLYLNNNFLSQPLPREIGKLNRTLELDLSFNCFNGSLPYELGTMKFLQQLAINYNYFTQNIPMEREYFQDLTLFIASNNFLSQQIPALLFDDHKKNKLSAVILSVNLLESTIPASIGNLTDAFSLELDANFLTGTVPDNIGKMQKVEFLNFSYNHLTGTLPESIRNISSLTVVDFSHNNFRGGIKYLFSSSPSLSIFYLQNNQFEGSLDMALNASIQSKLQSINIESNQLTGSLDLSANSSFLEEFIASSNCLDATIPNFLCSAVRLRTLVLDGMHSASSCRSYLFAEFTGIHTYTISESTGTLPECLFQLNDLKTLHLAGVGLQGTLPANLTNTGSLTDLVLAHNFLEGTIPDVYMERIWSRIRLSFNYFTGTLQKSIPEFPEDSYVTLRVNRLSGDIPMGLKYVQTIEVLSGNLFSCNLQRSSIPVHDAISDSYQCGSSYTNDSLYTWVSLLGATVIMVSLLYRYSSFGKDCVMKINAWLQPFQYDVETDFLDPANLEGFKELGYQVSLVKRLLFVLAGLLVIVGMPLYALLSVYYGTYTHQYVWIVSACFMSGKVPTICMELFLMLITALFLYFSRKELFIRDGSWAQKVRTLSLQSKKASALKKAKTSQWIYWQSRLIWSVAALVNVVVVVAVNAGYVYAITESVNASKMIVITIALSIFKVAWTSMVVNDFYLFRVASIRPLLVADYSKEDTQRNIRYSVVLHLFNNIVAPYIAEALFSNLCFHFALTQSPADVSSYDVSSCVFSYAFIENQYDPNLYRVRRKCNPYLTAQTSSYTPPYSYSYQCSSSLITAFAYVFIIRYIITGFLLPLFHLGAKALQEYLDRRVGRTSPLSHVVTSLLPPTFRPYSRSFKQTDPSLSMEIANPLPSSRERSQTELSVATESTAKRETQRKGSSFSEFLVIFDNSNIMFHKKGFVTVLLGDISVLMTFGVMFPPLAIVVAISVFVGIHVKLLALGRIVELAKSTHPELLPLVDKADKQMIFVGNNLNHSLIFLAFLASLFYSFSIFDTLADTVGPDRAYWVFAVVGTMPAWLRGIYASLTRKSGPFCTSKATRDNMNSRDSAL